MSNSFDHSRRFFVKSALPISEDLRREVGRQVKETQSGSEQPAMVFDVAQSEVERLITNTTYPNFLKSDMYLQYVQVNSYLLPNTKQILIIYFFNTGYAKFNE